MQAGFKLFAFFQRALGVLQILHVAESSSRRGFAFAMGQGLVDDGHPVAHRSEGLGGETGDGALAGAGAYGRDGEHGLGGLDHGVVGAQKNDACAGRVRPGELVHHVHVACVRRDERDEMSAGGPDEVFEVVVWKGRNSFRVAFPRHGCGVGPTSDGGPIGRETHDAKARPVAEVRVEVVEGTGGAACDEHVLVGQTISSGFRFSARLAKRVWVILVGRESIAAEFQAGPDDNLLGGSTQRLSNPCQPTQSRSNPS